MTVLDGTTEIVAAWMDKPAMGIEDPGRYRRPMRLPALDCRYWLHGTVALLATQVLLFWLSLDALLNISLFCTGSQSHLLAMLGYVHLSYAALFGLGLLSLRLSGLRAAYVLLICVALLALPVQAQLVAGGQLYCDGP